MIDLVSATARDAKRVMRIQLFDFCADALDARAHVARGNPWIGYPKSVRAERVVTRCDWPDNVAPAPIDFDVLLIEDPEIWVKIKPHLVSSRKSDWWFSHNSIHLHETELYDRDHSHDQIVLSAIKSVVWHCINIAEAEGTIT